jgi:menaquinol-cytochrome c reductase iron-sulfur subunit
MASPSLPPQPDRRNFITKATAVVVGSIATLIPALSGLFVFLDPLRSRKSGSSDAAVRVASLGSVPETGLPVKFPVLRTRVDAWNTSPNEPVGAVYLQRIGGKVRALNAKCPHTGCFVNFQPGAENRFHCPCHDSTFAVDGKILDPRSPSPRALDELPVEIRNGTEIWVTFQNFRPGVHEQIPV